MKKKMAPQKKVQQKHDGADSKEKLKKVTTSVLQAFSVADMLENMEARFDAELKALEFDLELELEQSISRVAISGKEKKESASALKLLKGEKLRLRGLLNGTKRLQLNLNQLKVARGKQNSDYNLNLDL